MMYLDLSSKYFLCLIPILHYARFGFNIEVNMLVFYFFFLFSSPFFLSLLQLFIVCQDCFYNLPAHDRMCRLLEKRYFYFTTILRPLIIYIPLFRLFLTSLYSPSATMRPCRSYAFTWLLPSCSMSVMPVGVSSSLIIQLV